MVYKDMTMGDGSGMGTMDASQMNMVFYSSTATPLYSNAWTPQNGGQYAGTCIFLIILAVLLRVLFAYKSKLERKWRAEAWKRKFIVVADQQPAAERLEKDPDAKTGLLTANGVEARIKIVDEPTHGIMPWRFSVDLPRALLYTCMVGIGYLLMLAVMTQNVGYFFSVLAGTFVGELALGRYIQAADDHGH